MINKYHKKLLLDPFDLGLGCCASSDKHWGKPVIADNGRIYVPGRCPECKKGWIKEDDGKAYFVCRRNFDDNSVPRGWRLFNEDLSYDIDLNVETRRKSM